MLDIDLKINKLAKELVLVEKKSFYGSEPERDRLKKMRELIEQVSMELKHDS